MGDMRLRCSRLMLKHGVSIHGAYIQEHRVSCGGSSSQLACCGRVHIARTRYITLNYINVVTLKTGLTGIRMIVCNRT